MKLYLLQHGDAVPKQINLERPLSDIGRADIMRLADPLKKLSVEPIKIFHSGKLRAQQSAEILSQGLAIKVMPEALDGLCPNDDPAVVIPQLEAASADVLIASHMPFVSKLCAMLLCDRETAFMDFEPGSIACVEKTDEQWRLQWFINGAGL